MDLAVIQAAARRIQPHIVRTPLLVQRDGPRVLFCKAECMQVTGSFKARGAFNALLRLPEGTPGVVTSSSGNHAQAVARAGRVLELPVAVVMPPDAPDFKRRRTYRDGAEIIEVDGGSDAWESAARQLADQRGWAYLESYDHPHIMAGQGTAGLELCDESGPLAQIYVPVSGGGLMAGVATAAAAMIRGVQIIAVEPERARTTWLSMRAGDRVAIEAPDTIADGLRVRQLGRLTWPVIRERVTQAVAVSDDEILQAMSWARRELEVVLEPSGAAALAAARRDGSGRVGVVLSGGNVEP